MSSDVKEFWKHLQRVHKHMQWYVDSGELCAETYQWLNWVHELEMWLPVIVFVLVEMSNFYCFSFITKWTAQVLEEYLRLYSLKCV